MNLKNIFRVNKSNKLEKRFIRCKTVVNKKHIRRETRDGVEHIIISSKTMPDDIVMNGIKYVPDEIAASYKTLERTFAPLGHPQNSDGLFISATDPDAIHNFHGGAFNENLRRENGVVLFDKVINVNEAKKTDRGKELLSRIDEIETNDNPRPIHTSVGVFLEIEPLANPEKQVNGPSAGQTFTGIARNMLFDHDAILLNELGAAQPHQGVGMAVNSKGEEIEANQEDLVTIPIEDITEMSHEELRGRLFDALNTPPLSADFVVQVFDSRVIYGLQDSFFSVPYTIGNGVVTITGIPVPVEENPVPFVPKVNQNEGEAMKQLILNALTEAKVELKGSETEAELFALYNKLNANQSDTSDDDGANDDTANKDADVVANALKKLGDRLEGIETKLTANTNKELDRLAEIVGNSDKFKEINVESAKLLGQEVLTKMIANCTPSHGIPLTIVNQGGNSALDMTTEIPA